MLYAGSVIFINGESVSVASDGAAYINIIMNDGDPALRILSIDTATSRSGHRLRANRAEGRRRTRAVAVAVKACRLTFGKMSRRRASCRYSPCIGTK